MATHPPNFKEPALIDANNAVVPFVVFGEEWGLLASSTQHLASHLVTTQPLLYVNAIGMRRPRLNLRDMKRVWGKLQQWVLPQTNGSTNGLHKGHLYSPLKIPLNSWGPIRRWNRRALVQGVQQQMKELGLKAPILLVSSPVGADAVGALGERLLIYYITDEYSALPGVDRAYVEDLEKIMLSEADLIFTTSTELQRQKKGKKTSTLLLPHGVDYEHFHSSADPLGPLPGELKNLPRPLLGFYGLLAPWVDIELLTQVALAYPTASVVLIGPAWSGFRAPKELSNVHWLGPRSYAELPRYAAHFDVALIPFQQNLLTASINPLKFLEYLALGLPVVSTPLPELDRFKDVVRQATTPQDFMKQIDLALADRDPARRQERFAVAARESWDARRVTLFQEIETALGKGERK
jgi:glycosyltransferase involved in cell wall biosynthesis